MKDKIIEMLGAGVTPVQVALACGVSESYISQLLADEHVEAQVKALRVEKAAAYVEHDAQLDSDEEVVRRKVRRNIDDGFLKPMELLKHFQVLNAARRKSEGAGTAQVPTSTIVQLHLPTAAAVQFKMTVDKQVVEIDGRAMTAMPAAQVAKMLREKKAVETLDMALEQPKMELKTSALLNAL